MSFKRASMDTAHNALHNLADTLARDTDLVANGLQCPRGAVDEPVSQLSGQCVAAARRLFNRLRQQLDELTVTVIAPSSGHAELVGGDGGMLKTGAKPRADPWTRGAGPLRLAANTPTSGSAETTLATAVELPRSACISPTSPEITY